MALTDAQFIAWLKSTDSIRCVLVEAVANVSGSETTFYLSSRPYVTGSTDTPASTAYIPCVLPGAKFSESLNLGGQASISYGDIEIDNRGGVRDAWYGYVWDNRAVQVYVGDPRWPRGDFRKVFDGMVAGLLARTAEVLNLHLMDKLQRLSNPLTEVTIGGTSSNSERLQPLAFGECFNVTPALFDPLTRKYQYHQGASEGVIEVRDNGAPLTSGVTVDAASGMFTLSSAPSGTVTASVQGDKPTTYYNDVSRLVQRIVTGFGPSATRFTAGDLDSTSLSAFATAHPQPVGFFAASRVTVLSACQQLAASVGAQVICTTLGLLRLVQVALPASGTPTAVGAQDFDYHTLSVTSRPAVKSSCRLAWCKNWTVQTSLVDGIPPESMAIFTNPWIYATQSDSATTTTYKTTTQPAEEQSLILVESDATAEAQRRRDLWKTQRHVYTFNGRAHLLLTELGDPITVTHPRFGLSGGVTGMVVSIARDWIGGRIQIGVLA